MDDVIVDEKYYDDKEYLVDRDCNIYDEEGTHSGYWDSRSDSPLKVPPEVRILHKKQLQVLDALMNGHNVFMTGPAGTGKTHLIKTFKALSKRNGKKVFLTALTGCAAVLLGDGAKTLHSWSGIRLGKGPRDGILSNICKNKDSLKKWKNTDILIVDEISMMSAHIFDLLNYLGQKIRKNKEPFGGIQLLFSGDFYQLPPVGDNSDSGEFVFQSSDWATTFPVCIELTRIFRQSDIKFSKILNRIRRGKIDETGIEALTACVRPVPMSSIRPTIIFPLKRDVANINGREHIKLESDIIKYPIKFDRPDTVYLKENGISKNKIKSEQEFFRKNVMTEKEFRNGDQVMCTRNIREHNLVNGSRGVVTGHGEDGPIVRFVNGKEIHMKRVVEEHNTIGNFKYNFVPLIYSWAMTIHKCQGSTLDLCSMDIGRSIFAPGQSYVALSRVKTLSGLYLTSFDPGKINVSLKVKKFYKSIVNEYHIDNILDLYLWLIPDHTPS